MNIAGIIMSKSHKKHSGFALFQLLIITLIVLGAIATALKLNTGKEKRINTQNIGAHLTIVVSNLLTNTAQKNSYNNGSTYAITQAITISDSFKATLLQDGINIDQATFSIQQDERT